MNSSIMPGKTNISDYHDLMADMYGATGVTIQYTPILVKQKLKV